MKNTLKSLTVILFSTLAIGQNLPNISTQTKGQLPINRLNAPGVAGLCLETDGFGNVTLQTCSSGGGAGTVTNFSAGNFAPLFTVSVSNPSTTPLLSFIGSNFAAHTFYGNNTSGSALPGAQTIGLNDLPGLGSTTINTSSPLGGGGSLALGGNLTITCASCITSIPQLPITKSAVTSNWINSYNSTTGIFTASQPAYSDISGTPQLAITKGAVASNWINSYSSVTGLFTATQPATSDLSDFPSQATNSGKFLTTNGTVLSWATIGGSGTVTSFSSGNLSPLFTTSVATATTTPAQSFSLSTAAAHTFFGNNTASTATPAYVVIGNGDLPGSGGITINTNSPLTGGALVTLGNSLTLSCASCLTSVTAHNLLSATHGDTTTHTVLRGDIIAGIGVAPSWTAVAKGGTNTYPKWNASGDVVASTNPASGTGSPTTCTNQVVTAFTLNADAAPTSTCSTITSAFTSGTFTATAHNLLSATHGDTTPGSVITGDVISGQSSAWARLAGNTTTTPQYLKSLGNGTVASAPSWSQVAYTDLSGVPSTFTPTAHNILSASHGDTTAASAVRGDGFFAIGVTPTWQRLAHPATTGGYFKWNGTDIVASSGAASGTGSCTNQVVTAANADASPTCSTITSSFTSGTFPATGHNLLSATHGDTTTGTVARGDVITGQGASPTWTRLAKGAASQCLQMDGTATDVIWGACATGGSGITTLNTLTATTQTFATGTSGTDFNISSVTSTHTFNIPDASASARGLVTTGTQTLGGAKTFGNEVTLAAATTSAASENTPSGTAPTTPVAGDYWRDSNGFNMVESTTTNGSVDVRSDQAGSVGPANAVRFTGDSNVAKVGENGGALQEVVQLTKTQTIQNKTLDQTDIGIWQFLCTNTSTTSTISCTPATARTHVMCRFIIGGYSGGGGVARAEFGNTSTVDTGTNYAFGGFNIASGSTTVTGISSGSTAQEGVPVSGSTTTAGRFVQLNISNPGAVIKYFTIETSGVNTVATTSPNLAHVAGFWNNTTSGIGVIQFKACTATTGACTTVNFTATTKVTCWGRDDN